MKKQFNNFWLAAAAVALVCVTGCKEDEPSTVPTQPTAMNIDNGAVISETEVTLSVSGSTVENEECSINYNYYIGTSQDNLEKTNPQKIKLTPYTQYFWYAKAETLREYSEPTEIRTFYCVPPFEIETDNGDGEWTAVLRFKGLPAHKGGKVTLTPDKQGYNYQKEIEIPAGQDSCYITMGNEHNPTNAAYTQLPNYDENKYYEPIIYTFKISINIPVGDNVIELNNSVRGIILNKKQYVYDHEFNVYSVFEFGDEGYWMTEDLRVKSYIDEDGNIVNMEEGVDYCVSVLSNGRKGILYSDKIYDSFKSISPINGYVIPGNGSWTKLIEYNKQWGNCNNNNELFDFLASRKGWSNRGEISKIGIFNAEPFGQICYKTQTLINGDILYKGEAACYYGSSFLVDNGITTTRERNVLCIYDPSSTSTETKLMRLSGLFPAETSAADGYSQFASIRMKK